MRAVARTIEEGDGTSSGQIGLLNGDEYKPEYNEGTFVIRAGARSNEQPTFRDVNGEIVDRAPRPGDLVKVSIEVWAMKQHSRINFTVKGIQMVTQGFAPLTGGAPVTPELLDETLAPVSEETLALFDSAYGNAAIGAGDEEEETEEEETEEEEEDDDEEEEGEEEEEEETPPPPPPSKRKRAVRKKGAAKKKATKKRATKKRAAAREPDEVLDPEDGEGHSATDDSESRASAGGGSGLFDNL
jgi:membrane peptidoglycan carboxypeptidase